MRSIRNEDRSRRTWRRSRNLLTPVLEFVAKAIPLGGRQTAYHAHRRQVSAKSRAPCEGPARTAPRASLLVTAAFVGVSRCAESRSAEASPPRSTSWVFGEDRAWGRRLILPLRSPAAHVVQPRAIRRWVGPGGVMPAKRLNAVALTAMAPITEKTVCQAGDGIAIWAIPCVAL